GQTFRTGGLLIAKLLVGVFGDGQVVIARLRGSRWPTTRPQIDQLLRVVNRQTAQHDGVHHAKDGSVRSNPQCERKYGHKRKSRALQEAAQAEANVLN